MPLDRLQSDILAVIAGSRSDDSDIFHADGADLLAVATRDVQMLRDAGFNVEPTLKHEGLYEAVVSSEGQHPTKLQWVLAGLLNFFPSVADDAFGRRLHMADLSVNKALAAAGRKEVRDFVDLALIHERLMPLWHALWAAPGKDSEWNPRSIKERIVRNCSFTQAELESEVDSLMPLDAADILGIVRRALEEAETALSVLPHDLAGNLFVDHDGDLVKDPAAVSKGLADKSVLAVGPVPGGSFPSSPGIDRAMIESLVEKYGWEGSDIPEF